MQEGMLETEGGSPQPKMLQGHLVEAHQAQSGDLSKASDDGVMSPIVPCEAQAGILRAHLFELATSRVDGAVDDWLVHYLKRFANRLDKTYHSGPEAARNRTNRAISVILGTVAGGITGGVGTSETGPGAVAGVAAGARAGAVTAYLSGDIPSAVGALVENESIGDALQTATDLGLGVADIGRSLADMAEAASAAQKSASALKRVYAALFAHGASEATFIRSFDATPPPTGGAGR